LGTGGSCPPCPPAGFAHAAWPFLCAVSTGGGFGHRWGRNGELCVLAVGLATTTG